jgi:DNA helicase II / ATP-dependent DNA helicase PcrA
MNVEFEASLKDLRDIQREAVTWRDNALLVLAGPGSGKTQVLTLRIAKLLEESSKENFRILALTFTTKAADEMFARVKAFAPAASERATIGTFHSFCAQVLRQHGVHIGIRPDFAVYGLDADRRSILEDAVRRGEREGKSVSYEDLRFLPMIDRLKSRLIDPVDVKTGKVKIADANALGEVYQLYEEELRQANALDFGSMIFETYRLFSSFPAIAKRYQSSHPFWLLDEFQDTNDAQYRLVKTLAAPSFRNIFAVADDDQIIYQWNGASFRQLRRFSEEFAATLVQLPTNYRCPAIIVEAANKLVSYNAQRTASKKPLLAGRTAFRLPTDRQLRLFHCENESEEAQTVANDIAGLGSKEWSGTVVLARTRALLDPIKQALEARRVTAQIAQRRDDFLSPEFRWITACLRQVSRPLEQRNLAVMVESFNRIAELELNPDQIIATATSSGKAFLEIWMEETKDFNLRSRASALFEAAKSLRIDSGYKGFLSKVLSILNARSLDGEEDLSEDVRAWTEITRDIGRQAGNDIQLDQFLQELALRSKEPSPLRDTVTLMTIHASKGREFDFVYVIGMAEDVMPSFQSRRRGDGSPEMEEERRSCFVAITRTKEALTLSWADRYRGYLKQPSRFLGEMNLSSLPS